MLVRGLYHSDLSAVQNLDRKSGAEVQQWVEDLDDDGESLYAFGLFADDDRTLLAYCTIGGADMFEDVLGEHELYDSATTLILSDVFVNEPFRHQNLGSMLINEAIKLSLKHEPQSKSLFAFLLDDNLYDFYNQIGFDWAFDTQEYVIVKQIQKDA